MEPFKVLNKGRQADGHLLWAIVCNGLQRSGVGHLDCTRPIPLECHLHMGMDVCFAHCCILDVLANAQYTAHIPLISDFEQELGENFPMWPWSYENVSLYPLTFLVLPHGKIDGHRVRKQRRILKPFPISALPALDCENQLLPKLAWVRFWSLTERAPLLLCIAQSQLYHLRSVRERPWIFHR